MISGANQAVERAIGIIAPRLEKQIMDKWKAGTEISLTIKGLSCAEFNERKTKQYIKNIYGVQSVVIRNCSGVTSELEVEALFNGTTLLEKMIENSKAMGLVFRTTKAHGNTLKLKIIRVTR